MAPDTPKKKKLSRYDLSFAAENLQVLISDNIGILSNSGYGVFAFLIW